MSWRSSDSSALDGMAAASSTPPPLRALSATPPSPTPPRRAARSFSRGLLAPHPHAHLRGPGHPVPRAAELTLPEPRHRRLHVPARTGRPDRAIPLRRRPTAQPRQEPSPRSASTPVPWRPHAHTASPWPPPVPAPPDLIDQRWTRRRSPAASDPHRELFTGGCPGRRRALHHHRDLPHARAASDSTTMAGPVPRWRSAPGGGPHTAPRPYESTLLYG